MKLRILLLLLIGVFLFLFHAEDVYAQVCAPNRVINQFGCVTKLGSCISGHFTCTGSNGLPSTCGTWSPGASGGTCRDVNGVAAGTCQNVCDQFSQSSTNCQTTGSITVSCNPATCQANAAPVTCSSGGAGPGSCSESTQNLTYSCWVTGGGGGGTSTPPPGQWGNCGSCSCGSIGIGVDPACRINDQGNCVWDPGGCPSGGSGCGQNGAICNGWTDTTTCCAGLTCNKYDPTSTAYGSDRCGRCSDPYYIRLGCGQTPDTWCGQSYTCDNSNRTCPNAQTFDIPNPPTGMSPADNTVFSGAQNTCGAVCTDDIDCGANFVEARMNRKGGNATKYRDMFIDAFVEAGSTYQENNARINYTRAFTAATANTSFSGGNARYTRSQNIGFTIGSLFSTLDILTLKSANSAYMDVYINGGQRQSGVTAPQISTNLNSQDAPPVTYQYPITVPFGSAKNFTCSAGACRLRNNPSSTTCVDDPTFRHIDLVARPTGSGTNYEDFDAIEEAGVRTENTSTRFTYTGTWSLISATSYSGGNERRSNTAGAMVSFDTNATSLTLISTTGTNRGSFDVLVDGVKVQTIVTTSATAATQVAFPITLPPKVTASGNEQSVKLSWNPGIYNLYELEVYPQGTDCSNASAFCGQVTRASHRYVLTPGLNTYVWRVRAINALCAFANKNPVDGLWSNFNTFTIDNSSPVTSTVQVDPGGTATLVGGVCQLAGASPYTAGGTVSVTKGAVTKTGSVSTVDGTYTVNAVPANTGYSITFAPTDPSYTCTCPSTSCTYVSPPGVTVPTATNYPFFVSQIEDPWYQTVGGDIGALLPAGNSVKSQIPQTTCISPACDPFFSLPNTPGNNATIGSLVVGAGTTVDLKDTATGAQDNNVGQPSRLVKLPSLFVPKENYDYFYRLYSMGLNPNDDFTTAPQSPSNARKPTIAPVNGTGAYFRGGDMTITNPWTLAGSESIVVFVEGNLTISANISMPVGTFVAFIVKGDIIISPSVGTLTFSATSGGQVQGFYMSDATISLPAVTGAGVERKFIGEGTFVARNGISIKRDFRNGGNGIQNNAHPVAIFLYRPDLVRNVPAKMKVPTVVWKESTP